MLPDPKLFARLVTAETGLALTGTRVRLGQQDEIELVPTDHQASQTFRLRSRLGWRSVEASFEPGAYAGTLVTSMHEASMEGRHIFESVLKAAIVDGAELRLIVDGKNYDTPLPELWSGKWNSFSAHLSRGQLEVNSGSTQEDTHLLVKWTCRLAAAAFALMPLQAEDDPGAEELKGYPEGSKTAMVVNRYERDRRNRAAALAIHGYRCKACDHLMSDEYGDLAATLVEVHHLTPVHALGPGYLINPVTDLVPLCPNCHSVAHTRNPPLTIDEIRAARSSQ